MKVGSFEEKKKKVIEEKLGRNKICAGIFGKSDSAAFSSNFIYTDFPIFPLFFD